MNYKEVELKDGQLVEKLSIDKDQNTLTSDCWLIQFKGLSACETCSSRNTDECGGGDTLKKMLNKRLSFNYTISYSLTEEYIKEMLIADGLEESEITEDIILCQGEHTTRAWLDEAIKENEINSSEEYFSCEVLRD